MPSKSYRKSFEKAFKSKDKTPPASNFVMTEEQMEYFERRKEFIKEIDDAFKEGLFFGKAEGRKEAYEDIIDIMHVEVKDSFITINKKDFSLWAEKQKLKRGDKT